MLQLLGYMIKYSPICNMRRYLWFYVSYILLRFRNLFKQGGSYDRDNIKVRNAPS